ncbi:MAG: DNA integrity scanning protein DisA nucleotide-binding domain protein, partial [Desulfovibrionaceae bacterium]
MNHDNSFVNLSTFHILDGLRDGLSHFSQKSRAALLYAVAPDDPIRVYDPQNLLGGHEHKIKALYHQEQGWRNPPRNLEQRLFAKGPASDVPLAGLVVCHGWSQSVFYQIWFTEHHPDLCSTGPTECWLEYAANLLCQDVAAGNVLRLCTSGFVLQQYAIHAVRDYIVDERSRLLGLDTYLRVYPTLDAVLAISNTPEEGAWPRGRLAFVEPSRVARLPFLARFPAMEQPRLENAKHVRKLLLSVERSSRTLLSDGASVLGIVAGDLPEGSIIADFRGSHGFLQLDKNLVCSFQDGGFHSANRKPNLVHLEEHLLESNLPVQQANALYQIITHIVASAGKRKHGCALVIDLQDQPGEMPGQMLAEPLDLTRRDNLELAASLAKVDGALHVCKDLTLRSFACLMDGARVPAENRARGARFNSALRFTSAHDDLVVVVVSA